MVRPLPSTRSLQIFSVVARHQNLSRAADELSVTHSALSQQLRKLESQLGVALLRRSSKGITLTDAGRRYLAYVEGDLRRMQDHMLQMLSLRQGESQLVVGVLPVLADSWLVPRLGQFVKQQPNVGLTIREFPNKLFVDEPQFDVALHYTDAVWPDTIMEPLMVEDCVAVCHPRTQFSRGARGGDFRQVPLLHLTNRPQAWQDWFEDAGVTRLPANVLAGHRFDLFSTLLEATLGGLGAAVLPTFVAARELRTGGLVQMHAHIHQRTNVYAVFRPRQTEANAAAEAFVRWARDECE
jgi:DNA-binding transcriptional LysR family regulator